MDNQEATFELTLKLTLPGNTLKKLKSYAMLSGMTVDELEKQLVSQVEPELSAHFDKVLTEGIVGKLSEMDGISLAVAKPADEPVEEPVGGPDDHQLSADDDSEENKSLAEQYESLRNKIQPQPQVQQEQDLSFDIRVPDAGGDAEKFLDSALEQDTPSQKAARREQGQGPYGSFTGAAKKFSPGKPRVKISEHTGDETGYFS